MKTVAKAGRLDLVGSIISFACAVHCLAFPILISTGSLMILTDFNHELSEIMIIIPSVLLCSWSVSTSYKVHKKFLPLMLLGLSLIALSFGRLMHVENLEVVFSTTGAILLASAHLTNRRLVKRTLS